MTIFFYRLSNRYFSLFGPFSYLFISINHKLTKNLEYNSRIWFNYKNSKRYKKQTKKKNYGEISY